MYGKKALKLPLRLHARPDNFFEEPDAESTTEPDDQKKLAADVDLEEVCSPTEVPSDEDAYLILILLKTRENLLY